MATVKCVSRHDIYDRGFPTEKVDKRDRETLISYMRSFEPDYRTASKVFDPVTGKWTSYDLEAYSDGSWGWDSGDIYLFETYGLKLDPDFVKEHKS